MKKKKICFVVAVPGSANAFLKDHIAALSNLYDIYLVGSIYDKSDVESLKLKAWYNIDIQRNISILKDIKAVFELYKYFKKENFDAVHSLTPKAGLLCAISSKFAGISHRIHIYTGQVWATRHGIMRLLLQSFDKLIALLDNHLLVDGEPQRQFLIENKILLPTNSLVLGAGSISGVNIQRFAPISNAKKSVRSELKISSDKLVYCFMGRQNRDKGIYELFEAFNKLLKEYPNSFLLMYGFDEEGCLTHLSKFPRIHESENFLFYGKTNQPELYLQASDVFCMPSYREGFGTSVLEASCLGLPVICSDIYGLKDTMVDNVTGLRCKVKDVDSLYIAMKHYADNPQLAHLHGANGRRRVIENFAGEVITHYWVDWYKTLLK